MTNFLYNPDRKGKEQLIAEFVVRNDILDDIMQDIESSDMKTPEQHYLLVGQRGTGKTTLLHRIRYAIEDSGKVNEWLIPVIFSEEQYNISELANLWENICHILEDYHNFEGLYEVVEQHISKDNFEEITYDILERYLKKHRKKLVLLIDNIGDLLVKFEDKEVRRLREILQTKSCLRIIAASPFYLDNILDYKQPLFEFFKVKRLEGLNKGETEGLLLKLGDVYGETEKIKRILTETPERVETLRILTGGVPRTIALMFRIFVDHEHESSLKDMERILDAVTPLYKHRMDDLPKQQQKIVDAVARHWDAISVKELKEKLRLDSKVISAQLNQLEKNQVIEKRTGKTKNHLYLVKERFWNIWYLMRYGRKMDKERVVWLIRFLECWYSKRELEQRIIDFTKRMKGNELPESSVQLFGLAYASLENVSLETRINLRDHLPTELAKTIKIDQSKILNVVLKKVEDKNYTEALELMRRIEIWDDSTKHRLVMALLDIPAETFNDYFYNAFAGKKPTKVESSLVVLMSLIIITSLASTKRLFKDEELRYKAITTGMMRVSGLMNNIGDNLITEVSLLFVLFGYLIRAGRIHIAHQFFTGENADFLKSKLDLCYVLVEYYRQNEDPAVLRRLPGEKMQIILEQIEEINKERNTFKP